MKKPLAPGTLIAIDDLRGFKRYAVVVDALNCIAADNNYGIHDLVELSTDAGVSWHLTRRADWEVISGSYTEAVVEGKYKMRERAQA